MLDHPNARSLHLQPVPRTGGIAVLAGSMLSLPFAAELWLPFGVAVALAAISFADDVWRLPTALRLACHITAAAVVVWYLLTPMSAFHIALLVLAVTWMTNLYNFMDGSDGLAGGMAVTGFGTYSLAAFLAGDSALTVLCATIAAASAAFLRYNFHPARIFLGDVGSIPLGFFAAALGLAGWRNDAWPLWFPLLVFGPFVADASITLTRRALRGDKVWKAHREHYYQRFVQAGHGHRRTAFLGYALMLVCSLAAMYGRNRPPAQQLAAFAVGSLCLLAVGIWIDAVWRRCRKAAQVAR